MPTLGGVYETVLYAEDLTAARSFYADVLGLAKVVTENERGIGFRVDDRSVLLIFDPRLTAMPHEFVPSHGAVGAGHIAFHVEECELGEWRERLAECGIEIETEVDWPTGAHSIYFRDPAGNSVELAAGEIWAA